MRLFSYRNKRILKGVLAVILLAALALLLFCIARFVYLQRYLVYSPDGVQLDYSQNLGASDKIGASSDPSEFPVTIMTPEDSTAASSQADDEMRQLSGYYVTTSMMRELDSVKSALGELESVHTLLFDMKSIYGNFYYSSGIPGTYEANADIGAIEAMIAQLKDEKGLYLIAQVPSFCDSNYALEHQSQGLPLASGALWMDSNGCYWLDPGEEDVQSYLVTIAEELAAMGFDEVVFSDFRFPDSSSIVYSEEPSKQEVLALAAQRIDEALSESGIRVSFGSSDAAIAQYTDRVYLQTDTGSTVSSMVQPLQQTVADPAAQIVFLTASRDTRFQEYGILRPLIEEDA